MMTYRFKLKEYPIDKVRKANKYIVSIIQSADYFYFEEGMPGTLVFTKSDRDKEDVNIHEQNSYAIIENELYETIWTNKYHELDNGDTEAVFIQQGLFE